MRRFQLWRFRRRLERILCEEGFQKGTFPVFTGKVMLKETRYP